MEELTIKVKIKNEVLPIPEAIDFLGCTLDQINYKQKPDETRSEKEILVEHYKVNPLELRIPNQFLNLIFKKNLPFDLEEKEYEFLIDHIIKEELELDGEIRKIKFNEETRQSKEYSVGLMVEERYKRVNKNKCREIDELILIKGFNTTTDYGKVSSADISQHVLAITPMKLDCRIINKLLLNGNNVTYICFSDIIYKKFTEILKSEEFISLPQIDFSEYVNELDGIIRTQLFGKICSGEYPFDILKELENFKKGIYGDKLWIVIENILRNIAKSKGCTGNSLGNYLEYLSSDESYRRLFEETKFLIKALGRNNLAHGKLVNSNSDKKYLAILCMKAIRDVYLNWCFFQSLDKCFIKMQSDLNTSTDELWEIYNKKNKRKIITVSNYSGEWDSDMQMNLKFENSSTKESKNYTYNINLIKDKVEVIE